MASNKNVANRWWDLYMNDDDCREYFNGLHLLCALYGNDEDDSDTLMQSMTANRDHQIETLEFATSRDKLKQALKSCMWNEQHPEGFFARLHSQLGPRLWTSKLERVETDQQNPQTWEDWGWMIYYYDAKLRCRNNNDSNGKETERVLLNEDQKTELQKRLQYYHGEQRNGKKVVKDWYTPLMSGDA